MGRATRWLKGLFGFTKNSEGDRNSNGQQDRNRCNIDNSLRDKIPRRAPRKNFSRPDAAWLRANSSETEKDQAKHAIAVAAATAVAADAAIAAARAAVVMVKLTQCQSGGDKRGSAAVKIQTVFRGYLARKALRALRGLVKLQALVRGYLVRRRANAVLQSMQALMRAQAMAQSRRSRQHPLPEHRTSCRPRKCTEKSDRMGDKLIAQMHSRRLSANLDVRTVKTVHENSKIMEVDSGRPKSRSCRTNASDFCYPSLSSLLPRSKIPVLVPDPDCSWNFQEFDDECRGSSAQSTPQFSNSTGADKFFGEPFNRGHIPGYMASTRCFEAKLRSLSAPRQRPRSGDLDRRLSVHEMMFSRSSLSGLRMQRSCCRAQEAIHFRNAVIR